MLQKSCEKSDDGESIPPLPMKSPCDFIVVSRGMREHQDCLAYYIQTSCHPRLTGIRKPWFELRKELILIRVKCLDQISAIANRFSITTGSYISQRSL